MFCSRFHVLNLALIMFGSVLSSSLCFGINFHVVHAML